MKTFKTETEFTKWFTDAVEAMGGFKLVFSASMRQTNGIPDRLISHPIWGGMIEFKLKDRPCRADQRIVIRKLLDRGFPVAVVRWKKGIITFENEMGREFDRFAVRDGSGAALGKFLLVRLAGNQIC